MVFDRFKERMRQGTGLSKDMGHFKGTDNTRVENMLKETDDWAHRLKSYKKHLAEASSANKSLLESTSKTLTTELPKIYDHDASGSTVGQPTPNHASQSVRITSLPDLITQQEAELKTQVVTPIDDWLAVHKEFGHKLKKLESFRLDLDTARRLHNRSDLERVRHQQKTDNVPDNVLAKIQEQSTELQGRRDAWVKYESEVHAELVNLVNVAANMHRHLAAALRIQSHILSSAIASEGGQLHQPAGSGLSGPMGNMALNSQQSSGGPGAYAYPGTAQPAPGLGNQRLSDPSYVQMST